MYDQFLITQDSVDDNKQAHIYSYEKKDKDDSKLDKIATLLQQMMDQNKNKNSFPDKMNSPKAQYPTTVVPAKNKDPPLEGGHSKKRWHVESQT